MNTIAIPGRMRSIFKTVQDINDMLMVLERLNESFFNTDLSSKEILDKQISYAKANIIKNLAADYNVNSEDKHEMGSFLRKLRDVLSGLPVVSLTIAIQPTQEFIDSLSNWLYANSQSVTVLDIRHDPTLLAGAVIKYKGKYGDYSLRKQIQKLFVDQKI